MPGRAPMHETSRPSLPTAFAARAAWVVLGSFLVVGMLELGLSLTSLWVTPSLPDDEEPAEFTVLAIGDSFTYGVAGVGYPVQLERILNERAGSRRFRVLNVALPGATTTLVADQLAGQLAQYTPQVVLVTTGENNSWNTVRLEQGAPWYDRVGYAVQRSRVYRLLDAARAGWSSRSFHDGAPSLVEAQRAANYLSDFNDTVGDEFLDAPRTQSEPLPNELRDLLSQAFQLEDQLQYKEAALLFQQVIDEAPTHLDAYTGLLECFSRLGRYDEAAEHMKTALYDTPGLVPTPSAFYELGITLNLADRHEEAVRAWIDGLKIFPESKAIFYVLGNSYWARDQPVWKALDVVDEVPGVERNALYRYLLHISKMSEGYASDHIRDLVSETFRSDIERIARLVEDAGAQAVFSGYPEHSYTEVREIAEAHDLPYVDFRPIFAKSFHSRDEYIGNDGFHCNTAGYQRMAEVFADEVWRAVGLTTDQAP